MPQSHSEAFKWYRKAADQGFAKAQGNLGLMYEYGLGVPKSDIDAAKWYKKAAAQGLAETQSHRDAFAAKQRGVAPAKADRTVAATAGPGSKADECSHCSATKPLEECSRCKKVKYCSVKCQRQDWQKGHKKICRK